MSEEDPEDHEMKNIELENFRSYLLLIVLIALILISVPVLFS